MMNYEILRENPAQHLLKVRVNLNFNESGPMRLEIPHWRPGRYENANYPLKMADFQAVWSDGGLMTFERIDSHSFDIEGVNGKSGTFEYLVYANEKNAGSSYVDEELIYLNFINLLVFTPGKENEPATIKVDLPSNYQVACSMKRNGIVFNADSIHELFDAPLLAAAGLHHDSYDCSGTKFHLWFSSAFAPDFIRIKKDFIRFTEAQIKIFGGIPVTEYHFLFLILPTAFYHGVEHQASTVIVLGPDYSLHDKLYNDFLGISSHELFHTWNVKAIRPADMQPYDYCRQMYSRLHYVTEGVTTYYGDLMLLKSGVWDLETFLKEFHDSNTNRFYSNGGGGFVSLSDASFESWVNGYQEGIPNRKISFYAKGALATFMLDQKILESSGNKHSMDDVMRKLYENFGKTGKGYTAEDFWNIASDFAGIDLNEFRHKYWEGTDALDLAMLGASTRVGLVWRKEPANFTQNFSRLGISVLTGSGKTMVANVLPGSPADFSGLTKDDELVAINGRKIEGNLNELLSMFQGEDTMTIHFFAQSCLKETQLKPWKMTQGNIFTLKELEQKTDIQRLNFENWLRINP